MNDIIINHPDGQITVDAPCDCVVITKQEWEYLKNNRRPLDGDVKKAVDTAKNKMAALHAAECQMFPSIIETNREYYNMLDVLVKYAERS